MVASIAAEKADLEASKLQSKINKQRLLDEEKRVQEQLKLLQVNIFILCFHTSFVIYLVIKNAEFLFWLFFLLFFVLPAMVDDIDGFFLEYTFYLQVVGINYF